MHQIITQILISLDKDIQSKYKRQFLNDDVIKGQCSPKLRDPTWKSNCPLLLSHDLTVISHIIWKAFSMLTGHTQIWLLWLPDLFN